MKFLFTALLFFTSISFYGQEQIWNVYEFDSIVSIEMPFEEVYELDTIIQNKNIFQLFQTNDLGTSFIIQRMNLEEVGTDPNFSKLPYDLSSLEKWYSEIVSGVVDQSGFLVLKQEKIIVDDKIANHIELGENNKVTYKSSILILNKYLYSFILYNIEGFNTKDTYFFESIKLNTNLKTTQFTGTSQGYRIGYLFGRYFFYVILIILLIFFVKQHHNKKR